MKLIVYSALAIVMSSCASSLNERQSEYPVSFRYSHAFKALSLDSSHLRRLNNDFTVFCIMSSSWGDYALVVYEDQDSAMKGEVRRHVGGKLTIRRVEVKDARRVRESVTSLFHKMDKLKPTMEKPESRELEGESVTLDGSNHYLEMIIRNEQKVLEFSSSYKNDPKVYTEIVDILKNALEE